jgi:hypothetical protein
VKFKPIFFIRRKDIPKTENGGIFAENNNNCDRTKKAPGPPKGMKLA